jgi:flagellar hook-associated protein 1 FlgK
VDDSLDIISSVRKMLNAVVNILAREVNSLHSSGKTLNGKEGGLFFEPIESNIPMEMGNIKISDSIKDLNNIVASVTDNNGDNVIAHKISSLRNKDIMESFTQVLSVDSYYQHIILRIGNIGNEALKTTQNQRSLVLAADNDRQSTMGVSLDEEMSNMIKFKYAYNAATKTIGVINEMLDTLINRTGFR